MFGFLKDTLKKTVEKLTKEVDKATENVEPTEEQKKEIVEEIKEEEKKEQKKKEAKKEKDDKKGFFTRLKEKITGEKGSEEDGEEKYVDEMYGIEVVAEEKKQEIEEPKREIGRPEITGAEKEEQKIQNVDIHKREEEGEREIEALLEKKKKEEKKKEEEKRETEKKKEEKGFFTRLKEKLTHKEDIKPKDTFEINEAEVKEFEEAFKEVETKPEKKADEEEIPVVTQTEEGETVFEMREKPTAVGKQKKKEVETKPEEKKVKKREEATEKKKNIEEEAEGTGFFGLLKDTIFKTSISEEKFEELFWDLEVALLENNVAVEVIELIKTNLKKELVEKKILRGQIQEIILKALKESIEQTFDIEEINIIEKIKEKKPYVIVFVGINGSGKTTTIAKMIQKLKDNNLSCVVAAGDTFRAAAIQQLEEHTNRLNVKLIKHDYGADPAAVGFDAIKYAQAHKIDCVLIDTAGRLHSNVNLMDEMKKIIRVTKPDFKIFIGEAITGNDCVDQARKFNEAVGIDGIILAKADVDEKGGAALSVSYVTKKPILYLGTGQEYENLEAFDKEKIMAQIGLE